MSQEKKNPPREAGSEKQSQAVPASPDPAAAPVGPPEINEVKLVSNALMAHEALQSILREKNGGWLQAWARNAVRKGGRFPRIVAHAAATGAAALAVVAVTGDPALALAVGGAVGVGVPPAASTVRLRYSSRLAEHRRSYPNVPEFRDFWAVTAYEFVLMLKGYNLRAQAAQRLRKRARQMTADPAGAAALVTTADGIAELLARWHPDLLEIDRILHECQSDALGRYADEDDQENLRLVQPLRNGYYDWLILEPPVIRMGKEQELLERDLRDIEGFREASDAVDPYAALARGQEPQDDA